MGLRNEQDVTPEFLHSHEIPTDIARTPGFPWITLPSGRRRRRDRKQKQGGRAGTLARLCKLPFRPLLPSIFLSNARSLANKLDELKLQIATNKIVGDTETWLHPLIPDMAIELVGRAEEGGYASTSTTASVPTLRL